MNVLTNFAGRFGTTLNIDEQFAIERASRYFLLNQELKALVSNDFFYAGTYLGKVRGNVFFPSFRLLAMIAEKEDASNIMIDDKTEWLFICGRDIFRQGIKKVIGAKKKGELTLILNSHGDCLGFGKILLNLDEKQGREKVAVKNISDIGDFLRRERH